MGPLMGLRGSTSWKRLKVGKRTGSYFKRAPKGANETPWSFGWRLRIEVELGLTEGATKGLRTFWLRLKV